jgi:hypothetical protein
MAAVFEFQEDNSTAVNQPPRGTTRTANRTEFNWKNIDDSTTAYSSSPITAGNNSFDKNIFGVFTGSYNQITNGLWNHVSGVLSGGLVVKACISGSGGYTTPSASTNANLTGDLTQTGLISTGWTVLFGGRDHPSSGGPQDTGKGASTTAIPAFTQYLKSQLQTTVAAAAGDTTTTTWQLQYQEN